MQQIKGWFWGRIALTAWYGIFCILKAKVCISVHSGRGIIEHLPYWEIAFYACIALGCWSVFASNNWKTSDRIAALLYGVPFATRILGNFVKENGTILLNDIGCVAVAIGLVAMIVGLVDACSRKEDRYTSGGS
jgi:hypothetical protein